MSLGEVSLETAMSACLNPEAGGASREQGLGQEKEPRPSCPSYPRLEYTLFGPQDILQDCWSPRLTHSTETLCQALEIQTLPRDHPSQTKVIPRGSSLATTQKGREPQVLCVPDRDPSFCP